MEKNTPSPEQNDDPMPIRKTAKLRVLDNGVEKSLPEFQSQFPKGSILRINGKDYPKLK